MKRGNGQGSVRKLSGKRRKPYQALVTDGVKVYQGRLIQNQVSLGVYKTKREALEAIARYKVNPVNLDGRDLTFMDVLDILRPNLSKSMQKQESMCIKHCKPILNRKVVELKKRDLQVILDTLEGKSRGTQTLILGYMRKVFRYCLEEEYIMKDYSQLVKLPKASEPMKKSSFSEEEIQIVLDYGMDELKILLYTGMRVSEWLDTKPENIHIQGEKCPYLYIPKGKTNASKRVVPIHPEIESIVSEMPYVGHSYHAMWTRYKKWAKKYNLERTIHELRHTFATYSKRCGMDDFLRRAMLGHSQKNLTDEVYTDALIEEFVYGDIKAKVHRIM